MNTRFWFHYSKERSTPGDVWITVHFNGKMHHVRHLVIDVSTWSRSNVPAGPAFIMMGRGVCEIDDDTFYAK